MDIGQDVFVYIYKYARLH